jgi:hypothetical protein
MLTGRKLPLTLAFMVLIGLAVGAGCRGFFVKPTLSSIAVGPTTPTINEGTTNNTVQMFAVGTFNDGSTGSPPVSWSSDTTSVATISNSGLVTSVSTGTSKITATSVQNPAILGTQTVTVTVACILSIAISPTTTVTFSPSPGIQSFQFKATAHTCNGDLDITSLASWSSSNTSLVTVSAGLATATQTVGLNGPVTISASSGGVVSTVNGSISVTGF